MAKGKYTKETCLELLCQKAAQLAAAGESRLPKRSDFAQDEVVAIKAFLGPWPRALEAAGLKEPPPVDRLARNRQKRIRAKRRRRELLCAASQKIRPRAMQMTLYNAASRTAPDAARPIILKNS